MLKRLFWLALGFGLGVGSSAYAQLRVRRVLRRYTPPEVAGRVGGSVSTLGRDVRAALGEGRETMRRREEELRGEFTVPGRAVGRGA